MTSVTNVVRNMNFDPAQFTTCINGSGVYVGIRSTGAGADDPSLWAFGCTYSSNVAADPVTHEVHIERGHVTIQGVGDQEIAADDYALPSTSSCSNCWPTVVYDIATEVATIEILESYPVPTASEILVPLVQYDSNATSDVWEANDGYIMHRGNIDQLATSIVFG